MQDCCVVEKVLDQCGLESRNNFPQRILTLLPHSYHCPLGLLLIPVVIQHTLSSHLNMNGKSSSAEAVYSCNGPASTRMLPGLSHYSA